MTLEPKKCCEKCREDHAITGDCDILGCLRDAGPTCAWLCEDHYRVRATPPASEYFKPCPCHSQPIEEKINKFNEYPDKLPRTPLSQDKESWEEDLYFSVIEDYIRDAERYPGFMKEGYGEYLERMRKHFEELKSFIRTEIAKAREEEREVFKNGRIGDFEGYVVGDQTLTPEEFEERYYAQKITPKRNLNRYDMDRMQTASNTLVYEYERGLIPPYILELVWLAEFRYRLPDYKKPYFDYLLREFYDEHRELISSKRRKITTALPPLSDKEAELLEYYRLRQIRRVLLRLPPRAYSYTPPTLPVTSETDPTLKNEDS